MLTRSRNIEVVTQRCSIKKVFLKVSRNLHENTRASLFFNKVAGPQPATLLKKEFGPFVFLRIFRNF